MHTYDLVVSLFTQIQQEFVEHAGSVAAIAGVVHSVSALVPVLRQGDIGGMAFAVSALSQEVLVEVIRSPEQVLVVIVNTAASGYSNMLCHVAVDKHWTFQKTVLTSLTLDLESAPGVAALGNWREV